MKRGGQILVPMTYREYCSVQENETHFLAIIQTPKRTIRLGSYDYNSYLSVTWEDYLVWFKEHGFTNLYNYEKNYTILIT